MKQKTLIQSIIAPLLALFMIGLISTLFLLLQINRNLPDTQSIKGIELKIPLRVLSSEQQLIAEFGEERRKPVTLSETPQQLIDAILASEDSGFFEHRGIDIKGLIRAALSNFRSGHTQQGASTITMQVARNFFLSREKTYVRKLKEVLLSIRLEQILSKDEILALYINKIFLGHRSYGFGAAAQVYYGKQLNELNLAQLAMMAGLPKAPSSNNPITNPSRAIPRRDYVLDRLLELGKINQEEYNNAKAIPVSASKHGRDIELNAPFVAEMARNKVLELFGEEAYWQGLTVITTVIADKQTAAEKALRKGLQAYDRRHGFRGAIAHFNEESFGDTPESLLQNIPNSQEQAPVLIMNVEKESAAAINKLAEPIALTLKDARWARKYLSANSMGERPESMSDLISVGDVIYVQPIPNKDNQLQTQWKISQFPQLSGSIVSMNPQSGQIEALVGGYDFFINKYNRAVQAIRQPGSNIKPFIYSASLDKGFTPASLISGAPIVEKDPTHGTIWKPENYSGKFYGPTRMRTALTKSMNLVSIRLLRAIGVPYTLEYLSRFGIDPNRFSPSLTLALGAGGITPLNLLSAYTTLANGGYKLEPTLIDYISDRDGNIIYQSKLPVFCDSCYEQYLSKEEGEALVDEANAKQTLETAEEELLELSDEVEPELTYEAPRVMSQANNFLTVSMMKDVVKLGTARKALALKRNDLAGKTGTTNDYVDAWFTGFNSKIAATVWVGFDEPATMGRGEAGSSAALPIWVDFMRTALKNVEEDSDDVPAYIETRFIDKATGQLTDELNPNAIEEYFINQEYVANTLIDEANIELEGQQVTGKLYEGASNRSPLNPDLSDEDLFQDDGGELELTPPERIIETEAETEGLF